MLDKLKRIVTGKKLAVGEIDYLDAQPFGKQVQRPTPEALGQAEKALEKFFSGPNREPHPTEGGSPPPANPPPEKKRESQRVRLETLKYAIEKVQQAAAAKGETLTYEQALNRVRELLPEYADVRP
jgi:hypothetical protein